MLLVLLLIVCTSIEAVAANDGASNTFSDAFSDPGVNDRIKIRVWWPSADMTDDQIAEEVSQIAEAGFGGIELIGISEGFSSAVLDAEQYGWGSDRWNHAVEVLTEEAAKKGLSVDLTIGPRWPAGVPGLDLSGTASSRKLEATALHQILVDSEEHTFAIPAPAVADYDAELVALVAARTEGTMDKPERKAGGTASGPMQWKPPADEFGIYARTLTLIDPDRIDPSNVSFDFAPSEPGEWSFFAFWSIPTGQTSGDTVPRAYVVDHYSLAGTEAMLGYWEDHMITDSLDAYWRENGGDMFEDSLELTSCDIPWSCDMASMFMDDCGYDLLPYLPLLLSRLTPGTLGELYTPLDDVNIADEVFADFTGFLSDMYIENHIKPIQAWCAEHNIRYRAQAQGTSDNGWVDSIAAAAWVDVVEGETLGMASSPDAWRSLAGAANMSGTGTVSVELGAEGGALYQISWQRLNELVNRAAMAGANRFVLHGFATTAQESSANVWPGWMPFDFPMFSEAWGPRQPAWQGMDSFTSYVSRLQTALQYGTACVDFAVYRHDMGIRTDEGHTQGVLYLDEKAQPAENPVMMSGWSYNYISPSNFTLDAAFVEDGILNPEYANYRALVINNEMTMALDAARTILDYAKEGLPVVLIGTVPYSDGTAASDDDEQIVSTFEELKAIESVVSIESEKDLPDALISLGITPSVCYAEPVTLSSQHRHSEDADVYYLYNYASSYDYGTNQEYYAKDAAVSVDVTMNGSGKPYRLDPWSGDVTILSDYTDNGDGTITLSISLEDGCACVIAITENAEMFPKAEPEKEIHPLDSIPLDGPWQLEVTSYRPGIHALYGAEDYDPADMELIAIDAVHLDALQPWSSIDGLKGISGIGVYSTTFRLGDEADGAVLDLGDAFDSILEVSVNGHTIRSINQISHKVDLGEYVMSGENELTITTASTLAAAVRTAGGFAARYDVIASYPSLYGLLGNVTLIPYTGS